MTGFDGKDIEKLFIIKVNGTTSTPAGKLACTCTRPRRLKNLGIYLHLFALKVRYRSSRLETDPPDFLGKTLKGNIEQDSTPPSSMASAEGCQPSTRTTSENLEEIHESKGRDKESDALLWAARIYVAPFVKVPAHLKKKPEAQILTIP